MYERNLVSLIKQLRSEFDAPLANFVLATLGQTTLSTVSRAERPAFLDATEKLILDAMLAVDGNSGKYPQFAGNVATVYSHPLSKGGSSNGHYNGNAETYMNIGEAMGRAMVNLNDQAQCVDNQVIVANEMTKRPSTQDGLIPAMV